MSYQNSSNYTISDNKTCELPQQFMNAQKFFLCFLYFFGKNLLSSILILSLIFCTVFFNFLYIFYKSKTLNKLTIFEKIFFGHAFVDGLTGLIDIPIYYIFYIYGYWPFSNELLKLWVSFDNGLIITTISHMMYISYARLRSIQCPNGYKNEILIKYSYSTMLIFWLVGILIWYPTAHLYGVIEFTNLINFESVYINFVFVFFTWTVPLLIIFYLSIHLFYLIVTIQKKKQHISNENKSKSDIAKEEHVKKCKKIQKLKGFRFKVKGKFIIIMGTFWIQW